MAKKESFHPYFVGTEHGRLSFGTIRKNNEISACMLQSGPDGGRHYIIPAIWCEAENGDIIIKASHGKIRLEAEDVIINANGFDGKSGNIVLDSNDKITLKSQVIDINASVSTKIFSDKTVEVIGKGLMNIYGGLVDFADRTTKGKPSKTCGGAVSINEERNK